MPPTPEQTPQYIAASLPQPQNSMPASQQPYQTPPASTPQPAAETPIGEQAKLLISQYKANPFQLNLALQQLKVNYLAKQFGITTKQGDK